MKVPKKSNAIESMKKVNNLENWVFTKDIDDYKRLVDVSIHLKHRGYKHLMGFSPKERNLKSRQENRENLKKLLDTGFFENYTLIGTKVKPYGIEVQMPYSTLGKVSRLGVVSSIFIKKMSFAKKIDPNKSIQNYYCVRMSVAIEVEGRKSGNQTIEDRFVIVKASSFENAYKKIEKTKSQYSEPYLNTYGELVRWKIESLDDCFLTEIYSKDDLDNPEGVEVYSKLGTRRFTEERSWDGNLEN